MNQNLLLISFEPFISRLKTHFELKYRKSVEAIVLPRRFFDDELVYNINEYLHFFNTISQSLDRYTPQSLRHLTIFFTRWIENKPQKVWNPLRLHNEERRYYHPQEILLSWLLLSYPEVRWVFLNGDLNGSGTFIHPFHFIRPNFDLFTILNPHEFTPLFDPCGLRNRIRRVLSELTDREDRKIIEELPCRNIQAAAIDEEAVYAYMNAYIAYRFGYRAWAITNWDNTCAVFEQNNHDVQLVFEDLYLNFADRATEIGQTAQFSECLKKFHESAQHISNLKFRDCLLPGLKKVRERILVTIGHRRGRDDKSRWHQNSQYFRELVLTRVKILYKPFTGIFDLWKGAGKWERFKSMPKYAEDFHWPPSKTGPMVPVGTHSAPGRLLLIAQKLIERAGRILRSAVTVPDAIHAATLALEAKELLGHKTPTTALEALALQHMAEITAESMFYGIEYNLNVKSRLKDIEREVKSISRWFNPTARKRSEINARLTIIENLARKFRELNQFEEEQQCLAEARKLRFDFWIRQHPLRWITWPVLKYIQQALYSVARFLFIVLLLLLFFAIIYFVFPMKEYGNCTFWEALSSSAVFFFTLQPPHGWEYSSDSPILWNVVLAIQGFFSFFNLTLLLTHLYMLISRR